MKAAYLYEGRARSLKDEIFETIQNTQLHSVSNLLKHTMRKPLSHQGQNHRYSSVSPQPNSQLEGPLFSSSPSWHSCSKGFVPKSTECIYTRPLKPSRRNPTISVISKGFKKENYHLSQPPGSASQGKGGKSRPKKRHQTVKHL